MRSHRSTLLATLWTLAALSLACGHTGRQVSPSFPLHDTPGATLSADDSVFVTSRGLEVPHRRIAVISTDPHRREAVEIEGVAELRQRARALGADAVIEVRAEPQLIEEIAYRPGTLTRLGTEWVTVYSLRGVAVMLEGNPAPGAPPATQPLELNLPPVN